MASLDCMRQASWYPIYIYTYIHTHTQSRVVVTMLRIRKETHSASNVYGTILLHLVNQLWMPRRHRSLSRCWDGWWHGRRQCCMLGGIRARVRFWKIGWVQKIPG
jgi:hypothetical protein